MTSLCEYRKKAGLTQRELSEKLGVTQPTITQYETGVRKPDIVTLKKLAVILDCTTNQLLEPIEI
jgi:transcriptional regulator with XRE-family HTH domain